MQLRRVVPIVLFVSVLAGAGYFYYLFLSKEVNNGIAIMSGTPELQSEVDEYTSPIGIEYLRSLNIDSPSPIIEQELSSGSNYKRYIASYLSDGLKIYGLLTVPDGKAPDGGFPAIIFNHGYIPPTRYKTAEGYAAYVDYLARSGFVVFKIDYRGNGESEGVASGTYFSSGYTIDVISALKSLQKYEKVGPGRIGLWGHSMAGNLVLRTMLVSDEVKAGVIWAGAVYSYEDFAEYGISDSSYVHRPYTPQEDPSQKDREVSSEIQKIREDRENVNFDNEFWKSISLTQNISYLNAPLQIHHAVNDPTVDIGYSRDLADVLRAEGKSHELYEYSGGGHNIESPYFDQAMSRVIEFYRENL